MKVSTQIIARVLLVLFAIVIILLLIRGCRSENKMQQAKKQVNETFQRPYRESDSIISTLPSDSIRARYEEVKRRRFPAGM